MNTPLRIVGFVAGMVAVFAVALYVGRVSGPDVSDDVASEDHEMEGGHAARSGDEHEEGEGHAGHEAEPPSYRLELDDPTPRPGLRTVTFRVVGDDGEPLRDYDVVHEKKLHMVVVGTPSLTSFQHVHPSMDADGRWTARLRLAPGADYQVYADATTAGENFVATTAMTVRGGRPHDGPVPPPTVLERTGPYAVSMSHDGQEATFTVSRGGRPVTDLQPYLGANGHLVVIEAKRFDYVHAHPLDGPAGPDVRFEVAGGDSAHRMFFEFKHDGAVRRVAFTVGAAEHSQHGQEGSHEH